MKLYQELIQRFWDLNQKKHLGCNAIAMYLYLLKLGNDNNGFVNGEYVNSVSSQKTKVKKSFFSIFKRNVIQIWLMTAIIFGLLYANKVTKKDSRFSKGVNQKTHENNRGAGTLIGMLIGIPISLIISLFYSIYKYFEQ